MPTEPIPVPPALDVTQRVLLTGACHEADRHSLFERALGLAVGLLQQRRPAAAHSGAAARARHRVLVQTTREALAADHDLTLTDLARQMAVSPHYLSRVFRSSTGSRLSRHRMRLRARAALDRLADGERDLTRLAADLNFADHSHLCRVLRAEIGPNPTRPRHLLRQ